MRHDYRRIQPCSVCTAMLYRIYSGALSSSVEPLVMYCGWLLFQLQPTYYQQSTSEGLKPRQIGCHTVPAHQAVHCQVELSVGRLPDSSWPSVVSVFSKYTLPTGCIGLYLTAKCPAPLSTSAQCSAQSQDQGSSQHQQLNDFMLFVCNPLQLVLTVCTRNRWN